MSKETENIEQGKNKALHIGDVNNSTFNYNAMKEQTNRKVAIRKGCPNQQCFCTGKCQEIIGWRDKLPNEH